jgi:hypothetical protein
MLLNARKMEGKGKKRKPLILLSIEIVTNP